MTTAQAPIPMTSTEIVQAAERLAKRWMFCERRGGDLSSEGQSIWTLFEFFTGTGRLQLWHLQALRPDETALALRLLAEAANDRAGDTARLIYRTYERVTENH